MSWFVRFQARCPLYGTVAVATPNLGQGYYTEVSNRCGKSSESLYAGRDSRQIMKGLHFLRESVPGIGELTEVAPGILWIRLPLPFALDHVNIYLIEDGAGWALVDTGINNPETRAIWESVLDNQLRGSRLTRVIAPHFHPDHVGLAGWLTKRFGLPLYMSAMEYCVSLSRQGSY